MDVVSVTHLSRLPATCPARSCTTGPACEVAAYQPRVAVAPGDLEEP